jgi:glycosyltransferase involved in cell wall biosynthesis
MDGSAIWVQSAVQTFNTDPRLWITLPLKAIERRTVTTALIRRLPRVDVVDSRRVLASAEEILSTPSAVDVLLELDRQRRFDIVLVRSFEVCREIVDRGAFPLRLWSCYILEPERDLGNPVYREALARISRSSAMVLVQSPAMAELLRSVDPTSADRLALLPPAIADRPRRRADPDRIRLRLFYTGKFHPFYPVDRMVEAFVELRRHLPRLEFELVGDKVYQPPDDPTYAPRMRRMLRTTPGVRWYGALPRDRVETVLARGGVALSIWDYRHGSRLNDLVVSTKLLDYASVGLPVVLMRTRAQEEMLGLDYPLFVSDIEEVLPLLRRTLSDPLLYRTAAERTWQASRAFTYSEVYEGIRPSVEAAIANAPSGEPGSVTGDDAAEGDR